MHHDQWFILFIGGMLGMFLPDLCVRAVLPLSTKLPAWDIARHMAEDFAKVVSGWGFYFICFIGLLILFST